jgi:4-amino-4-deoxy-L-arabinose transferase-like glycosyltransferase
MSESPSWRRAARTFLVEREVLLALMSAAGLLLLWGLGQQYLWQDEAQTALIAKTILSHGVPLGHDGINSFSQEGGAELDRDLLYRWHPWLPFYLVAACFRLLGVSTLTARLPFALLGIASVFVTFRLAEALFPGRRLGPLALALLASSVPFLLLARQSRYYSAAIFFALLALDGYARGHYRRVLAPSSVALFFTHSLYFGSLWLAVLAHAAWFRRDRWKELCVLALISAGLPIAWQIHILDVGYFATSPLLVARTRFLRYLAAYGRQLYDHLFSPLWLVLPLVAAAIRRASGQRALPAERDFIPGLALLLLFLVAVLAPVSALSVGPFFRYLGPMLPALAIVVALLLSSLRSVHRLAPAAAVVLCASLGSLPRYLVEITHDMVGPTQAVAGYLNQNGRGTDTVAVSYGDMPLKFYTRMKVVGGLTGESLAPARSADWVWVRAHAVCPTDAAVKRYLLEKVDLSAYEAIPLDAPDTVFDNREDPALHRFRTAADEAKVVLFRRRR